MKDSPYVLGWRLNKNSNKPRVKTSVLMLTKHGIAEGEWDGSDWVQYRWSCIVKDSDVLYWIHLEDLTQLEKEGEENGLLAVYEGNHNWKFVRQEQPEVDLEKEITDKSRACCNCVNGISLYPNCYCWQHEYCNTDEPYKIPKEDWVDTAKTCKKFELELGYSARKEK